MKKNRNNIMVFKSFEEVEKRYFPKTYKERNAQPPDGAREFGIFLAEKSLDKILKNFN